MAEVTNQDMTRFQHANLLFRNKEWEKSLCLYIAVWNDEPHLRRLVAWNMAYLLKKAPEKELRGTTRNAALELMRLNESDGIFTVSSHEKPKIKKDPTAILDEYIKQRIADKTLKKNPDKSTILFLANEMAAHVGYEASCLYAERHLPENLHYTMHALLSNAAIRRGDQTEWLHHLNQYLQAFSLAPLYLKSGDSLLSRLATKPLPKVANGPLVTIIMPAWNAESTVEFAACSILEQTWQPLELIIVDDASDDATWSILNRLANVDSRVRIHRNKVNVGPYVSKNIALTMANGDYITGHDADDWACPQRIEQQMTSLLSANGRLKATLNYMIRLSPAGIISKFAHIGRTSMDGVARLASISCLFEAKALRQQLGYWDSVRFAADSEMIGRAQAYYGEGVSVLPQLGMLCLDLETSLTNDPVNGIHGQNGNIAASRKDYRTSWRAWHQANLPDGDPFLPFPLLERRYEAVTEMVVPYEHQKINLDMQISK